MSAARPICHTCRFRVLAKVDGGRGGALRWVLLCHPTLPARGRCLRCDFYEREPGSDDE